jgi:nicotinamide-nucleotide amidase
VSAFPDARGIDARRRNFVANSLGPLESLSVAERNGAVVAHAFLFDLTLFFGEKRVSAGGIASVGVAPEVRGTAPRFPSPPGISGYHQSGRDADCRHEQHGSEVESGAEQTGGAREIKHPGPTEMEQDGRDRRGSKNAADGGTGVAGPTEQDGVAVGTVCFGIALPDGTVEAVSTRLPGDRERIRQFSTISGLNLLRMRLASLP